MTGKTGLGRLATMTILAHALTAGAYLGGNRPAFLQSRSPHYRVHLSKAERRGKSYAELQVLRAERAND